MIFHAMNLGMVPASAGDSTTVQSFYPIRTTIQYIKGTWQGELPTIRDFQKRYFIGNQS
jgi:hypothetical protein